MILQYKLLAQEKLLQVEEKARLAKESYFTYVD